MVDAGDSAERDAELADAVQAVGNLIRRSSSHAPTGAGDIEMAVLAVCHQGKFAVGLRAESLALDEKARKLHAARLRARLGSRAPNGPVACTIGVLAVASVAPFALVMQDDPALAVAAAVVATVIGILALILVLATGRRPLSVGLVRPLLVIAGLDGGVSVFAGLRAEGPLRALFLVAAAAAVLSLAIALLMRGLRPKGVEDADAAMVLVTLEVAREIDAEISALLQPLPERLAATGVDVDAVRRLRRAALAEIPFTPVGPYPVDPDDAPGTSIVRDGTRGWLPEEARSDPRVP